jgi:hypothetical protein
MKQTSFYSLALICLLVGFLTFVLTSLSLYKGKINKEWKSGKKGNKQSRVEKK